MHNASTYQLNQHTFKDYSIAAISSAPGRCQNSTAQVLLLTLVNNNQSFGFDRDDSRRNWTAWLGLVSSLDYPKHCISVGMLVSDPVLHNEVLQQMPHIAQKHKFNSFLLVHRSIDTGTVRTNRKKEELQLKRRMVLARLRNFLLFTALTHHHEAVLWVDADILEIPPALLHKMVVSNRDIIVPNSKYSHKPWGFDMNSWLHNRTKYTWNLIGDEEGFAELDSVGGAVLFVRADVFRQGVVFTTSPAVGATWHQLGTEAVETEGLCLLARPMGFRCWAMPGETVVHSKD
eukprot:jgi/Chrzof1/1702/Cz10g17240.t1